MLNSAAGASTSEKEGQGDDLPTPPMDIPSVNSGDTTVETPRDLGRFPAFIILAFADLALLLLALRFIKFDSGFLEYGDLPGYYNYGSLVSTITGNPAFYPTAERLLAGVTGPLWAQNGMYLASWLVIPFGIYAFLVEISGKRFLSLVSSIALGTFVNPGLVALFLGGGFEYGFWLLFAFLSMRYLWRAQTVPSLWPVIVAALFLGLSITWSIGYNGILLEAIPISYLIVQFNIINPGSNKSRAIRTALFFGITGLIVLPVAVLFTGIGKSILSSSQLTSTTLAQVLSNVGFTFSPYGPALALFNGSESWFWIVIIVLSFVGLTKITKRRLDSRQGLVVFSASLYLVYAGLILLIHGEYGTWIYTNLKFLDSLDSPLFFLLAQLLVLPPMLLSGIEALGSAFRWIPVRILKPVIRSFGAGHAGDSTVVAIPVVFKRGSAVRGMVSASLVVALITVIAAVPVVQDLGSSFAVAQGPHYLAPETLSTLNDWFEGNKSVPDRSILVLPESYAAYTAVGTFIPFQNLWVIPLHGNAESSGYNVTSFEQIQALLFYNETGTYSELLGEAGVEYVIILDYLGAADLVPSYLSAQTYSLPLPSLMTRFLASPTFTLVFSGSNYTIFRNLDYLGVPYSSQEVVGFPSISASNLSTPTELLTDTSFSNSGSWGSYLSTSVSLFGNGTAELRVNGSAAVPYVILWTNIPLPSEGAGTLGTNSSSPVVLNASLASAYFGLKFNVTISRNVSLEPEVYWYNVSNPSSFYSEFAVTSFGVLNSTDRGVNSTFHEPPGAILARLIFDSWSPSSGTGVLYLKSPQLMLYLVTQNLGRNASVQFTSLSTLTKSGILSSSAVALLSPIGDSLSTTEDQSITSVLLYSGQVFDPLGNASFQFVLPASAVPLVQASEFSVVLIGRSLAPSVLTASLVTGQTMGTRLATLGDFVWSIPSLFSNESVKISVNGSVLLSLIGVLVPPVINSLTGQGISAQLPLGRFVLQESAGLYSLNRDLSALPAVSSPVQAFSNVVALVTVLLTGFSCLCGWLLNRSLFRLPAGRRLID